MSKTTLKALRVGIIQYKKYCAVSGGMLGGVLGGCSDNEGVGLGRGDCAIKNNVMICDIMSF
tara:strand:+ start:7880 stop:8065 length:186 start_codon:yes stop_codon:yes gene_type:complete